MRLLPGGLVRNGERQRTFAFRHVDGRLESALADAATAPTVPHAVTAVLAAALAEVGGAPVDATAVRALSVGDRQFLMRQLSAHLGRDVVWLTAECGTCRESFDFEVRQADLPVKEAGNGFPCATAGTMCLRVPTGDDQEAIAGLPDDEAVAVLFDRCLVSGEGDSDAAQAALEAVAPEVALAALVACPSCGAVNEVAVDPYLGLSDHGDEVFGDVHRLASAYHWSEADILALPRPRRQFYLELIDRARGLAQ